jgi:hypothetical protein
VPQEKIFAQARDELFSHINRCGVLSATDDDRTTWMNETIDYIGERYPDLVDPDLQELHAVGIRFCQPAINNVATVAVADPEVETAVETVVETATAVAPEEEAPAEKPLSPTSEAAPDAEATQEQDGDANAA